MSWPARTWVAGELVTATLGNAYWRDPQTDLRAGGIAITSQAAQDFIHASSATQLARKAVISGGIPRYNGVTGTWEIVLPLELAWPVGSIYRSVVSTNPATLFGFGTWTAFGSGRVGVSLDSGNPAFDTVEETGGSKTHTLTEAEMPAHTHVQDAHTHTQDAHNHAQNAHDHTFGTIGNTLTVKPTDLTSVLDNTGTVNTTSTTSTNNAATAVNQSTVAVNQNTGGGAAHNNLQPYIVAYVWKRTA